MIWHPYTIQKNAPLPIKIVSAKNEFLYDEKGNSYIDSISSWWISIHGHNHPKIIEAIKDSLDKLDHVMLAGLTNHSALELAKKLISFTDNNFIRVFYSDNGSCANEISIKIAIQYFKNKGQNSKVEVIHFTNSYHGDTIGAMSVSGKSYFTEKFIDILFPSTEFPSPDCYNCPVGKKRESCSEECLVKVEEYLEKNSEKISAIIVEPLVNGANGMKMYKKEVLEKLKELTLEYDLLFIFDEVFTGFGRTGKNFAFEQTSIIPDIINLAKGLSGGVLPLAATLVNEKVYSAFYTDKKEDAFYHGHTMTGNPSACAASLKTIELFESENRIEDVLILEFHLKKYIEEIYEALPFQILNRRVLGGIGAFEIDPIEGEENLLKEISKDCLERGVMIRPLGNTFYVCPPYTITRESITKVFETLGERLLFYKNKIKNF
ncbi:MAG: adenosylmethionine--8-amino-7-oxononanoate transaminase [Leptospiraceae bacterium]|nr:adenosylmethionine--8-amino-7-oxononanoate transaminase [Leptospiraceae bacterium]